MNKLLEFGRRTLFYIRDLSGYEERRIRTMRINLENHIKQAEERKAAIRRIPEQTILSEVRRVVEGMQTLNKRLEESEAAIDEYFKLLDKEIQNFIKFQLEGEQKTMNELLRVMEEQAEVLKNATVHNVDAKTSHQESECSTAPQASARVSESFDLTNP